MPITRISGSELYCLAQKGYQAGDFALGNSVYSLGAIQSLSASIRTAVGSELLQASQAAQEARQNAYQRMNTEALAKGKASICDIRCNLNYYPDYLEFTSTGSLIHPAKKSNEPSFSSAANGQSLYAQLDAGYQPLSFVFGNVVYASGLAQGLRSSIKCFSQGEVRELSEIFKRTKNLALKRIIKQAKGIKANAILGLEIGVYPFGRACEMLISGSACHHPQLSALAEDEIITCGLSDTDLWNCAKLGYAPMRLLLATSIYSLGVIGTAVSSIKSFFHGEVSGLTKMMHEARVKTLAELDKQAKALGADEVMGVKTYVYSLGNGLIEFFALGTAMKKLPKVKTESEQLPPQAFSFYESNFYNSIGSLSKGSPFTALFKILAFISLIVFFVWLRFKK